MSIVYSIQTQRINKNVRQIWKTCCPFLPLSSGNSNYVIAFYFKTSDSVMLVRCIFCSSSGNTIKPNISVVFYAPPKDSHSTQAILKYRCAERLSSLDQTKFSQHSSKFGVHISQTYCLVCLISSFFYYPVSLLNSRRSQSNDNVTAGPWLTKSYLTLQRE